MSDGIRENTAALHKLVTCIAVQTVEMEHQTEAIKELKDELSNNGIGALLQKTEISIVSKVTKTFYKNTSIFGFIVTVIAFILYIVLR